MAKAKNLNGSDLTLDDAVFGAPFNGGLVHESVRAELNARRAGTHATKTRGLVSGGGAKPWRQKGTGRARAGSSRSPIWTGGGVVFGPQPRSYTFKVNRKERRAAMRSALSVHAERGSIAVFDVTKFDTPSTKAAAELLAGWVEPTKKGSILIVLADDQEQAALSFRNLRNVLAVLPATAVGVSDVIGAANVLASAEAIEALTARVSGSKKEEKAAKSAGADSVAGSGKPEPAAAGTEGAK